MYGRAPTQKPIAVQQNQSEITKSHEVYINLAKRAADFQLSA